MGEQVLQQIRRQYLNSGDFNGLYLGSEASDETISAARQLVADGKVQVVSEGDYPNPHIRPWPSRRTVDDQLTDLLRLRKAQYGLCLYPTSTGMQGVRLPRRFAGRASQAG